MKFERPCFYLGEMIMLNVAHCKYLGGILSDHNCDLDLKRQMRKFYTNANMLIRNYFKCSVDVKCCIVLYCIVLYCVMRPYTEGRLDRYRIGIILPELSEIRTQPWLSEGSLTCDLYHHRGPIF